MFMFSDLGLSVVCSVIYEINYTKLDTFIFLKEDDLCYVANGSFVVAGLKLWHLLSKIRHCFCCYFGIISACIAQ